MPKLHLAHEASGLYMFGCPGCGCAHGFYTMPHKNHAGNPGPVWEFNGDLERPTFKPSLLVNGSEPESRCHLFMRDGRIQFLGDCHHELAGQTVDCPDWEGF